MMDIRQFLSTTQHLIEGLNEVGGSFDDWRLICSNFVGWRIELLVVEEY